MNKVYNALDEVKTVYNGVFLAGPSPRVGQSWTDWRIEFTKKLRELGFDGDVFNPVNPNYDKNDPQMYEKQCGWEKRCLHYASLIVFWVDRTEEHPALTTNVEFGIWSEKAPHAILAGFPPHSEHVGYLKWICEKKGIANFDNMDDLARAVVQHFSRDAKSWFTSDTHFGSERHLELSRRPWTSVEEMDLNLISNWNKRSTASDYVYHLGDFGVLKTLPLLNFKRMNLLMGNYERNEENFKVVDKRVGVYTTLSVNYGDGNVVCVHEPISGTSGDFYLFGHIHEKGKVKRNGYNVGIDANNYELVDLDTIRFYKNAVLNFYDDNVFCENCK